MPNGKNSQDRLLRMLLQKLRRSFRERTWTKKPENRALRVSFNKVRVKSSPNWICRIHQAAKPQRRNSAAASEHPSRNEITDIPSQKDHATPGVGSSWFRGCFTKSWTDESEHCTVTGRRTGLEDQKSVPETNNTAQWMS